MGTDENETTPARHSEIQPDTPVVAIGASAGGVKALSRFFEALPADPGAAFVVVVHLDPTAHSELPDILAARARMPVKQVKTATALHANCIYVIPPDRQLRLSDHEIAAVPFDEPRGHRAPIDAFYRSLASQHGEGFAVILTGAGSDGAIGVKAVKESGGIVLVQDPSDAEYPSMPRAAIQTEAADFILPLDRLPAQIIELLRMQQQMLPVQNDDQLEQLRRVLAHLRVRTGHDFSHYKRSTIIRRVRRRMQVVGKETLERYVNLLRNSAEESQALLSDLLISVTTFFRDPKAFEALASLSVPRLFEGKESGAPIRVWVPGCATGEEAYSITILLLEEAARHELRPEIQVFASDMDSRALAIAREGCYPLSIAADMSQERLRRFFQSEGDHFRVKRELRDRVLFAHHSLLKDPPFSHLDLISCRNLLIYFDRELQQQVLVTLHYGLVANGFLFLGSSESAEHPDHLFHAVDRDARIYQSTGLTPDKFPDLPCFAPAGLSIESASAVPLTGRGAQAAHREALEANSPPSILVDESLRALHLSETAGRYLLLAGGPMTTDVTDLVREELRFELRTALHHCFECNETVFSPAVLVNFDDQGRRIHLLVKPVGSAPPAGKSKRALVFFIDGLADAHDKPDEGSDHAAETGNVRNLRRNLELAQVRLRTTREESEAATEELRAANEELQSINEEYRSTAEELETSKEELQSINEELQTVNTELNLKLETVSRANSDLQNLIAATDFATLFLDPGLRITRFTPRVAELFSITPTDIGRPITDFTHRLDYEGIPDDAQRVLRDLAPVEREIQSRKGEWYLVRFRPYRTVDDKIDGVVVTFVDVTERRKMEDALRRSEERLRQETELVELSHAPIFVWDYDGQILQWNRGSEELYGYTKEEALGHSKLSLLRTAVPGSSFEAVREALLRDGGWRGELHHKTKDGRTLIVESHIALIEVGGRRYVLESTLDVTHRRAAEARQHLLLRELTHRVKNTLTVVQSIVSQTWRTSPSSEAFIDSLNGRICALANSHKLLVESEWLGADLGELAKGQLAPYITEKPDRLRLEGEAVRLPPDVATPFGLVLHELATNAAKYGALSNEKGTVDLSWSVAEGNNAPTLRVVWRERGGPKVKPSAEAGFGTRLIKAGVPGSKVEHTLDQRGVVCTMEIPFPPASEHNGR